VRALIVSARRAVATAVNASLTTLYWQIGTRIRRDILREKRAGYGDEILHTLSTKLNAEFGRGFSRPSLAAMVRFAEVFPDQEIISTLSRQLRWSHFRELLPLDKPHQRDFRKNDKLTPDLVFKDPYVLDFLGLRDTYSEKDLEAAILRDIERFLLDVGAGFAFVERQKRIVIDGEDLYLDLLLFHRRLRRLVLIELKLGAFQAADFGQTRLYLRWLDRHVPHRATAEGDPREAFPRGDRRGPRPPRLAPPSMSPGSGAGR
jgi:predicted nuclease of restriction endonuclease-like (RecB) superfamily